MQTGIQNQIKEEIKKMFKNLPPEVRAPLLEQLIEENRALNRDTDREALRNSSDYKTLKNVWFKNDIKDNEFLETATIPEPEVIRDSLRNLANLPYHRLEPFSVETRKAFLDKIRDSMNLMRKLKGDPELKNFYSYPGNGWLTSPEVNLKDFITRLIGKSDQFSNLLLHLTAVLMDLKVVDKFSTQTLDDINLPSRE